MTRCTRPVKRETAGIVQGRPVVIVIEPPNLIGFRLKGLRRIEYMTAEACYWWALKRRVNLEQLDKARARKAKNGKAH